MSEELLLSLFEEECEELLLTLLEEDLDGSEGKGEGGEDRWEEL